MREMIKLSKWTSIQTGEYQKLLSLWVGVDNDGVDNDDDYDDDDDNDDGNCGGQW